MDENGHHHFVSLEDDGVDGMELENHLENNQHFNDFMPIELRQLESTDYADLFQEPEGQQPSSKNIDGKKVLKSKPGMLFSNVLYPRR